MRIDELDYELPETLIAAAPAVPRDCARLLVYGRNGGRIEHRRFFELPEFLRATDLLVVNDTRVLPAKLELRRPSGARIPGLFVHEERVGLWTVMLRSRGRVGVGDELLPRSEMGYRFKLIERTGDKGMWRMEVQPAEHAAVVLAKIGEMPVPPYIERVRGAGKGGFAETDRREYQTVYAREGRSVAAPTAGLHFTPELLARIEAIGVRRAAVNLEVGLGTFLPVEAATLEEHKMHRESYSVSAETIGALREARGAGRRIVAVGTTAVRTLEAAAEGILSDGPPTATGEIRDATDICIQPGHEFRLVDALITNFHLPRSTLMALVAALTGLEELKRIYAEAVREGYRFYSYGDAMLIV